jgi:NitT/TauT family transport system ATP-binding protein
MQSELLRIWQQTDGRTVLFVTHQIDEAIFLADRIVVMTARPGRIKEIIDVPFVRPRKLDVKRSPEFSAIYDHIWKTIEDEVRTSMAMT